MKRTTTALLPLLLSACHPWTPPALTPATRPAPGGTGGAAHAPSTSVAPMERRAPVTILVSIDGFHPDYLRRGNTPTLDRLAAEGVVAAMRPSFPTKTFPNHWTLVTGVRPDRHGIVANSFEDAARPNEKFTMASEDPFWWNAAEPIWVAAERAGIRTAAMFWPGASVAWGERVDERRAVVAAGTRPADWWPFGKAVTGPQRVEGVIDWLRRPAATRPQLLTLYFDTVDTAGHDRGPAAPELGRAIADVDRSVGRLVAGLAALGQPANLVIVADHGMAATSSERVIALDALLPKDDYRIIDSGPFASIVPAPGKAASVTAALTRQHRHMQCWPKARIPARLHYGQNPRVAPILCLAEPGWLIQRVLPSAPFAGGNHGYDPQAPVMRALFIASGPAFRAGRRLDDFDNVAIAPLLRTLLGLPADSALDGDDRPFRAVLVNP